MKKQSPNRQPPSRLNCRNPIKPVVGTSIKPCRTTGETIVLAFASISEADRAGFSRTCIKDCIKGKQRKHAGFTWALQG